MRVSGCWMRRAIVLAGGMISLGACATASSERGVPCVPVRTYTQDLLTSAGDELAGLPANSTVVLMLEDYSVMRAQAHACRGR